MSPPPSERNRSSVVNASLRDSIRVWWQKHQLAVSWILLVGPLTAAMFYSTMLQPLLPYLFVSPISIIAAYLIYRSTVSRLRIKTSEVEALSKLHLATAEALATAIDAKDQITHCHVRRVQVYAARMGKVFDLSDDEISA